MANDENTDRARGVKKLTNRLRRSEFRRRLSGGNTREVLENEGITGLPNDFVRALGTLSEEELTAIANLNLKLGPSAAADVWVTAAVRCYGADRVLFGSDCPIYRSDWTLDAVRQARIPEEDRLALLNGNAARLIAGW